MRKLVRDLAADGTTVLVSSHLLSEIEQVATHVGMMVGGKLVRRARSTRSRRGRAHVRINDAGRRRRAWPPCAGSASDAARAGPTGRLTARLGTLAAEEIAAALVQSTACGCAAGVERPDLEDLFVSITGEGFDVLR